MNKNKKTEPRILLPMTTFERLQKAANEEFLRINAFANVLISKALSERDKNKKEIKND